MKKSFENLLKNHLLDFREWRIKTWSSEDMKKFGIFSTWWARLRNTVPDFFLARIVFVSLYFCPLPPPPSPSLLFFFIQFFFFTSHALNFLFLFPIPLVIHFFVTFTRFVSFIVTRASFSLSVLSSSTLFAPTVYFSSMDSNGFLPFLLRSRILFPFYLY